MRNLLLHSLSLLDLSTYSLFKSVRSFRVNDRDGSGKSCLRILFLCSICEADKTIHVFLHGHAAISTNLCRSLVAHVRSSCGEITGLNLLDNCASVLVEIFKLSVALNTVGNSTLDVTG